MPSSSKSSQRLKATLDDLRSRHSERHRPTGFGFVLADRIDYVDAARWDAVATHGSVFLSRSVLRAIEKAGPSNVKPRYALVFRNDTPVAAVVVQIVTVTGTHLFPTPTPSTSGRTLARVKRLLAPVVAAASEQLQERVLVVGNLMAWGAHGVAFVPTEDATDLWRAVAEAVYRIRRAERLDGQSDLAMIKDFTGAQTGFDVLRRFSYRPLETEPNMVLAIDPAWRTYEDYLGALDARNRKKAKDLVKKLTAAGCAVEHLSAEHASDHPRLHELYLAVQGNANVRLVTLPLEYFSTMAAALGERWRCTVIRRDQRILGFVTSVRDGDTAIGYYIGFDRTAANEGLPLYFKLLHVTIADAIGWGCKRLSLGRTALEPKAGLGARPEPMHIWVRHRVPAVNWLLRGVLGAVPHEEAPERNPFKTRA